MREGRLLAAHRHLHFRMLSDSTFWILYLALPSLAWSLVYRSPKVVFDVVLLLVVEQGLKHRWQMVTLRSAWISLSAVTLLLEWNIFPESYGFYLGMWSTVAGSRQGRATTIAVLVLALFVLLPARRCHPQVRGVTLSLSLVVYGLVAVAKVSPWGRQHLVDLRVPALRAMQVLALDGHRLLSGSILGARASTTLKGPLYELASTRPSLLPNRIGMFVLESWGEAPNDLANLRLRLEGPGVRVVESGYVAYRGSTLPGEVRELCGQALDFSAYASLGLGCIPNLLTKRQFHSTALHGYDGHFYYRHLVYPNLGFKEIQFKPDLAQLAECPGAFVGTCDDVVVDLAISRLRAGEKQLVYVMTLSGHEPVDPSVLRRNYVRGSGLQLSGSHSQIVNRALIVHTLRQASHALPDTDRTWLYFVGDHNPPSMVDGAANLPEGQVPYLLFELQTDRAR